MALTSAICVQLEHQQLPPAQSNRVHRCRLTRMPAGLADVLGNMLHECSMASLRTCISITRLACVTSGHASVQHQAHRRMTWHTTNAAGLHSCLHICAMLQVHGLQSNLWTDRQVMACQTRQSHNRDAPQKAAGRSSPASPWCHQAGE